MIDLNRMLKHFRSERLVNCPMLYIANLRRLKDKAIKQLLMTYKVHNVAGNLYIGLEHDKTHNVLLLSFKVTGSHRQSMIEELIPALLEPIKYLGTLIGSV